MMDKVLKVRGMTCHHCKTSVTDALLRLPTVKKVIVDLPTGEVQVGYDEHRLDEGDLRQAIEDIGFEVA